MLNRLIANTIPLMPQSLVWLFSKDYIAGTNVSAVIIKCHLLNQEKALTTIDILGEYLQNIDEALINKNEYLELIDKTQAQKLNCNYSLKPSFFGLLINKEIAYEYIREIVERATKYQGFIRIDMEDSQATDREIELFIKLYQEFPKNVGLVFQACLKRTLADITNLIKINNPQYPINLRICKGIYDETAEIAWKDPEKIKKNFSEIIELMLKNKMYPAMATHDKSLITSLYSLLNKYHTASDKYEFQMLYGVTPSLRSQLIADGHRMRIYVPYGKQWFGYCSRRLKENPKIVWAIIKAIFIKN